MRPGRPVVRVERLRTADGTPMAYEVGYYPSMLFPGLLQRELSSLYDVFANEYGVVVTSGEQTVRAESADAHQARILRSAKRAPLLVQERVTYAGDRVIELSTSWYRADRYRIHMAITPRGAREN
jgi:GntR family transcriptional regulator